ncbi:FAD binding domain-containing protein [Xylariaceae sp. FL0804]|nr:FAD binding domain-containing protein [Xylariaceae sp. FL0804]
MERHRQAVRVLSATVRGLFERGEPFRIAHGSTNSTRPPAQKAGARRVDVGGLSHVLAVDVHSSSDGEGDDGTAGTALVEPSVPMDRLVAATLRHGLVPPVVMEFPGITAGGGFAGTAGESSSFRHGYFDDTVRSVEMILPDGEVVTARRGDPGERGERLLRAAGGAVGTLGVATLLEVGLVRARRFVRVTYRRVGGAAEAVAAVRAACEPAAANDYVDGILFGPGHGVVVTGQLTDEEPAAAADGDGSAKVVKVQTFSGAADPWFYMHAEEATREKEPGAQVVELVPLAEYLFRYDRGGFWVGRAAFDYFAPFVPFTRATRWLLDDFLHTRMMYRALHASGESARFLVQDVALPYDSAAPFVDWVADRLGIWPLWLCPLKTPAGPTFHPHLRKPTATSSSSSSLGGDKEGEAAAGGDAAGEMLNIGVWGWGPRDRAAFVRANRDLEARVDALGGMKWLYAHAYYDEPDFWRIYGGGGGRAWYDALRDRYRAAGLPSVYDKVQTRASAGGANDEEVGWRARAKATWPVGGLYGIWKSIQSGDYHLHRRAEWKWRAADEDGGQGGKQKLS